MQSRHETVLGTTEVCKSRGEYVWTVRGFSAIGATKTYSGEFELVGNKWRVYTNVGAGNVSFFLDNEGAQATTVAFWLQLLDTQGGTVISKDVPVMCFEHRDFVTIPGQKSNSWGWAEFVKHSELMDEKKGWIANDKVTFKVVVERSETVSDAFASSPKALCQSQVSQAMQALLDCGSHSDVTLVIEGTEIAAHRGILGARSQFFAAMFSHKMSESLEGVVRFDDIALPVFRQVLKFIYTGDCEIEIAAGKAEGKSRERKSGKEEKKDKEKEGASDMARELLAAADRFQLGGLQLLCSAKLANNLTAENAAELLILADAYHAPDLKKRVLAFIRADSERLTEIMDTDEFQKLSPGMLLEVLGKFAKSKTRAVTTTLTKADVKKLKVSELRSELENRGLETSGMKTELMERLENAVGS